MIIIIITMYVCICIYIYIYIYVNISDVISYHSRMHCIVSYYIGGGRCLDADLLHDDAFGVGGASEA